MKETNLYVHRFSIWTPEWLMVGKDHNLLSEMLIIFQIKHVYINLALIFYGKIQVVGFHNFKTDISSIFFYCFFIVFGIY